MAESAGLALQARMGAAKMLRNGQLTPGYLKTARRCRTRLTTG
jgi:hypothetical protein